MDHDILFNAKLPSCNDIDAGKWLNHYWWSIPKYFMAVWTQSTGINVILSVVHEIVLHDWKEISSKCVADTSRDKPWHYKHSFLSLYMAFGLSNNI